MPILLEKKKTRGRMTLIFDGAANLEFRAGDPRPGEFSVAEEYSEGSLTELRHKLQLEWADKSLTNKLSISPRSVGQARLALKEKGFNSEVIAETIEKFVRVGYLNDRLFAVTLVNQTLRDRPAGRGFALAVLRKKYIERELAEEVVNECFSEVDEVDLAERLLRKQWWRLRSFDIETARQKGYTHLARRAIGYDSCRAAFDKLAENEPNFSPERFTENDFSQN